MGGQPPQRADPRQPPQPRQDPQQQQRAAGPKPASIYQSSFGAGVLDPMLWYRSDLAKWHSGAAQMINFFVHVQGATSNRPGTQYIGTAANPAQAPKLVPFIFNNSQTYILEFGGGYIRFISNAAYVVGSNGQPVQVATPYSATDVFNIRWVQSNDVLTVTHPSYAPYDLNRLGATDWTFTQTTFGEGLAAPTFVASGCNAYNGNAANTGTTPGVSAVEYTYVVTAVSEAADTESVPSAPVGISNYNIGYFQQYGNYNNIEWSAVPGASYYNLYRMYAGSYGLIGSTTSTSFLDQNIEPDTTKGTPAFTNPFANGNNPVCVTYYQQRRVFAGSYSQPQTFWMSQSGDYSNFDVHQPTEDDDAITASIAANQANIIEHLVSVNELLVLTSGGAWVIGSGSTSTAISPTAISAQPQVFVGASSVQPLVIGYDILYCEAEGSHVRDLSYNYYAQIYLGDDKSLLAQSLIDGYTIVDWTYARSPFDLVWAIRNDGTLLGLTYMKEQDVYAWHQHATVNGGFASVACVPENTFGIEEDAVYFSVNRTINGQQVCYIERLHSRLFGPGNSNPALAWFVDCGLQYSGVSTNQITGLSHLVGQTVSALVDGVPHTGLTVSGGGAVSLPNGATGETWTVGLPMSAQLQMLPIDSGEPTILAQQKRVSRVYTMLKNSQGLNVSSDGERYVPLLPRGAPTGGTAFVVSGIQQAEMPPSWDQNGQVAFLQVLPLPCTILGVHLQVEVGSA